MIYIANQSEQKFGGGFSFIDNLRKALPDKITENYDEAEVFFVAGASMIKPELAHQAKKDGKRVILRVDNFLKHTRNQGKGMSRMLSVAHTADVVVYQSEWARDFLSPYLNKTGPVIRNGIDLDLFKPTGEHDNKIFLYSRFNRDNSKNWEEAQYFFMKEAQRNTDSRLWIVGQFSPELVNYNFDFFNGENIKFWGVLDPLAMATVYQSAGNFIYTYFADACSNTLIEALCSGCQVPEFCRYYLMTGGAPEIMRAFRVSGREYFSLQRMGDEYGQLL